MNDWVILSGAGVSADAGLPPAATILGHLLDQLIPSGGVLVGDVAAAKALCFAASAGAPATMRFEAVMGWLFEVYGEEEALAFIDAFTEPDLLHLRLAQAGIDGATNFTVNFDDLIERALGALGAEPATVDAHDAGDRPGAGQVAVYKLHGSLRYWRGSRVTAASAAPQVTDARIGAVSHRLELNRVAREQMNDAVSGKTLLVVGYSGSDDLDIVPALRETTPRRVIWVEHSGGDPVNKTDDWLSEQRSERQRLVGRWAAAGTDVSVFAGETKKTLDTVGFSSAPLGASDPAHPPDWRRAVAPWVERARRREPTGLALAGFLLSDAGRLEAGFRCFEAAPAGAGREDDDGWTRARREYELAQQLNWMTDGDLADAARNVKQAREYAAADADRRLLTRARLLEGRIAYEDGDSARARALFEAALAESEPDTLDHARLLEWRGRMLTSAREWDEGLASIDQAIAIYERLGEYRDLIDGLTTRAVDLRTLARIEEALADARDAERIAGLPQPDRLFLTRVVIGACLYDRDELAAARATLTRALVDLHRDYGAHHEEYEAHQFLGLIALAEDDLAAAEGAFADARRLLGDRGMFGDDRAHLACDLATVALFASEAERAQKILDDAEEEFESQQSYARATFLRYLLGGHSDETAALLAEARAVETLRADPSLFADMCAVIAHFAPYRADFVEYMESGLAAAEALGGRRRADAIRRWLSP